ncbi:MAG: glucose-6-phosphate isomerase [Myxococcales bacterium]|nr:glucose-6-phosphate isomerase [Myxococcales bacterium]MCB9520706.1 glucose-6-phosphate isomerase [Myxococcales bacterium]MCB9532110.1 glucose-6-phosphate isomerase [Myxococcales bacterium]
MIEYDYTYSARDVIGARGVDVAQLGAGMGAALAQLQALHERRATSYLALPEHDRGAATAHARGTAVRATDVVVLGIGGSSLGTRAVYEALVRPLSGQQRDGSARQGARLHFVENVDPVETLDILDSVPLETTVFNVVTKSGGTVETMAGFFLIRDRLIARFGVEGYRARVVATTDPLAGVLRQVVNDDGLEAFDVPPGVGGRFSVLSAVGLYPLAAAGLDTEALLRGAAAARDAALRGDLASNPAATFAAIQVALYQAGVHDVVLMPYASGLRSLAAWFVQLWAESLGKSLPDGEGVGPTPIVAVGATDQHSQLQLFMEGPATKNVVFVDVVADDADVTIPEAPSGASAALGHIVGRTLHEIRRAELSGVRAALAEVGRPTSTFSLPRVCAESLGGLMMTLEAATGIAGALLGVDPYDQPGVELAKKFAHGILGREADARYATRLGESLAGVTRRVAAV